MRRALIWPALIVAGAAAAVASMAGSPGTVERQFVVFGFALLCPGLAFVRLLGLRDFWATLTLGVAVSLVLDSLVAEVMVLARLWSPFWGLMLLAGLSAAGAALQVLQAWQAAGHPRRL